MNKRNFFRLFSPTEMVAISFIAYFIVQIIIKINVLNFRDIKWSAFPRIDIFFILLSVFFLKQTRNKSFLRTISFVLLILTYFSFTGFSKDFFIPLYKIIPPFVEDLIVQLKYLFILFFIFNFYYLHKVNKISFIRTIRDFRIFIPFFIVVFLYPIIPLIINSQAAEKDLVLIGIDRFIFMGYDPVVLLEKIINPLLTEFLAFTYSFYGPFFGLLIGIYYLEENYEALEELLFFTTLSLSIGYIFYTIVPAIGPMYTQHFSINLDFNLMKEIKYQLMDKTRIDHDCFPSLHTTISLLTLHSAYKNRRKLFWPLLPLIITIPFACVYLRYHYVIDVLSGILLFIIIVNLPKLRISKND